MWELLKQSADQNWSTPNDLVVSSLGSAWTLVERFIENSGAKGLADLTVRLSVIDCHGMQGLIRMWRSHGDSRHSGIQWTVASRGVWSMQWSVRYFLDNSVKHQLPSSCSNYVAFTFEVQKGFQVGLKTHPSTKRAWGRFVWSVF